jgi:hypothetical protein
MKRSSIKDLGPFKSEIQFLAHAYGENLVGMRESIFVCPINSPTEISHH